MTITTVGYDLNPNSFFGKLVGGFCALCGIFIMTLPVPIVVNSFTRYGTLLGSIEFWGHNGSTFI